MYSQSAQRDRHYGAGAASDVNADDFLLLQNSLAVPVLARKHPLMAGAVTSVAGRGLGTCRNTIPPCSASAADRITAAFRASQYSLALISAAVRLPLTRANAA